MSEAASQWKNEHGPQLPPGYGKGLCGVTEKYLAVDPD